MFAQVCHLVEVDAAAKAGLTLGAIILSVNGVPVFDHANAIGLIEMDAPSLEVPSAHTSHPRARTPSASCPTHRRVSMSGPERISLVRPGGRRAAYAAAMVPPHEFPKMMRASRPR